MGPVMIDYQQGLQLHGLPDKLVSLTQSASDETATEDADADTNRDPNIQPLDMIVSTGENDTVEPVTGISYPETLNGFTFIGCGVRTKYLVFHAYTIGLYLDLQAFQTAQHSSIEQALMDPNIPRIFCLVMNRNVTSAQYIAATFEALTPLMRGKDLNKLEEMTKQEMPDILHEKTEIYLMVARDRFVVQVGRDRAVEIISHVLTCAVCESYLGPKPVSPATRKAVLKAMKQRAHARSAVDSRN